MSNASPSPSALSLAAAHQLLKQWDCTQPELIATLDRTQLSEALLLVARHSDYQILGICADDLRQGQLALQHYAVLLGYEPDLSQLEGRSLDGSVYLKFNPKTGLCYVDSYTGPYRGVLISCQSAYESGVNDTYGHFPLDL